MVNLLYFTVAALVDVRSANEDDCRTRGLSPLNEVDDLPLTDVYVIVIIIIVVHHHHHQQQHLHKHHHDAFLSCCLTCIKAFL